jgi:transcriptional antiterminator RfaH
MHQKNNTFHGTQHWYAVHCKQLKERLAAVELEKRLGLTVYLPEVIRHFRRQVQRAPLFPRYLFVDVNLEVVTPSQINSIPGVVRLVAFGEMPQPVPAVVIEAISKQVDQFNAQGGLLEHRFHPGQTVRVKGGPLEGLEGVFVGPMDASERVRLLIEFLGRLQEVKIEVNMLEKADCTPQFKGERRTRGKGRFIR